MILDMRGDSTGKPKTAIDIKGLGLNLSSSQNYEFISSGEEPAIHNWATFMINFENTLNKYKTQVDNGVLKNDKDGYNPEHYLVLAVKKYLATAENKQQLAAYNAYRKSQVNKN